MGVDKHKRPILTPHVETDHLDLRTSFLDGVLEGRLQWNAEDGTLEYGLPGGSVVLQVGQELLVKVVNKTGVLLPNGALVYANGTQGNRPTVVLAKSDNRATAGVLGMLTEDIAHNGTGYLTVAGLVRDVNTDGLVEGGPIWLSDTVAGGYRQTQPAAPNFGVAVGSVMVASVEEGIVLLRPPIFMPLVQSLSDVLAGAPNDGDTIRWSAANQRFEFGP